ncbi:TPA: shikimate kinase [Candidatus Galligastranaerophilus intestinavium]|uniref:Shikimate kinase n=1 Tax=Candidatus Galligastranaerophilus intestinavium TaxID=2840836 RepID=A0A9D1FHK6_9BACT|nr:shikimate kinase [Candidatus Galligastranaerophilus intestinavium]
MQKKYKNIILTGMMGAGKTTVGKELATIMNCNFIDLDETIEKNYGKISDIFKQKGEEYFRQIETLELKKLNIQEAFVLSTGGGIVLKDENIKILQTLGYVFYLEASTDTIYERIKNQKHRPLLNTPDPKRSIEEILSKRKKLYENSGEKITVNNKNVKEIAEEIYERIVR